MKPASSRGRDRMGRIREGPRFAHLAATAGKARGGMSAHELRNRAAQPSRLRNPRLIPC